jgi:hypothetical protein
MNDSTRAPGFGGDTETRLPCKAQTLTAKFHILPFTRDPQATRLIGLWDGVVAVVEEKYAGKTARIRVSVLQIARGRLLFPGYKMIS